MRYSEVAQDAETVEPLLISADAAGQMLSLKPWDVWGLCKSKQLRAGKVGKQWRIDPASVREYAARITTPAEEQAS